MPVYKNAYLEKKFNLSTGTCYGKRSVNNDVLVVSFIGNRLVGKSWAIAVPNRA